MNQDLLPGTHELIRELMQRLVRGESFDNPKLRRLAEQSFGGTRAQGVYSPRDAYDALETAVNEYLRENLAPALLENDAEALPKLRALVDRLPTQTDRTLEQTRLQQFSTPPTLAFVAARVAHLESDDLVLEPSAGTGSLAIWARATGARVLCNEINPRRNALLASGLGFPTYRLDGEIIDDLLPEEIIPTIVLMNPPFSSTGGRVQRNHAKYGLRHIESALRRLKQGGRLVAIAGEPVGFHRSTFTEWWRKVASCYNIRANLGLPGSEYVKYGTNAAVQILVIDKIGPTPGGDWQAQLDQICWGAAKNLEAAWSALQKVPPRGPPPPECAPAGKGAEVAEADRGTVFVPYISGKLRGGREHPAIIVEPASMAAVTPPNISYRPRLPLAMVTEGKLSNLQLERVIYAGQRHEQRLPDGARGGFYVGDGTGVGKGRVLAGIILDNWFQNRRRALWLSVNNDLIEATRRDLNDLGVRVPLARINDYPAGSNIALTDGVLFSSYASLISEAKSGVKRMDQLQRWLGFEPVIILDEAHKAKNALASGRGDPTQTGQAVIDLQDAKRNPEYRIVYSSATGATDVRNMAYMTRLGLWGAGTSFPGGFSEFLSEIESGGVGAMEMVSRDMKSLGMYLSGSISFGVDPRSGKAVEYRERVHVLTPEQRKMYDCAAAAWRVVLQNIGRALVVTNASPHARARALNKFWGDHQRFFRQVICAFKVPSVLAEAETALRNDKSAVISLVGTGEARTRDQIAKTTAEGGNLEDLDFTPREIIAGMIERGFPTALYQDKTDPASGKVIQVLVTTEGGDIVQSKEALALKQKLIDGLSALHLPENPLDQLVNHFGETNVSEITGRSR
ncbi:MAG: strawberry notch family protein, partial [Candidatus Angelobacter sp.]